MTRLIGVIPVSLVGFFPLGVIFIRWLLVVHIVNHGADDAPIFLDGKRRIVQMATHQPTCAHKQMPGNNKLAIEVAGDDRLFNLGRTPEIAAFT